MNTNRITCPLARNVWESVFLIKQLLGASHLGSVQEADQALEKWSLRFAASGSRTQAYEDPSQFYEEEPPPPIVSSSTENPHISIPFEVAKKGLTITVAGVTIHIHPEDSSHAHTV